MRDGPRLTVDGIAVIENRIVLVRRANPPFRGRYALPGGFVEAGETIDSAVVREFLEETGLLASVKKLVGVYSDPERDPRGHTVSVVFELEVKGGEFRGGDDAAEAGTFPLDGLPKLAFDHDKIVADWLATRKA